MRRLFALCGAIALAACTPSVDSPDLNITLPVTETNVAGTFLLTSANGNTPPYLLGSTSSQSQTLLNDRIVIHEDLTWADTLNYRVDQSDGQTGLFFTVTSGSYDIADGHINFTMLKGGTSTFKGAVVGDNLSVDFQGRLFLYSR